MPNPWVIAALAGFSVVAFFVYLSELDQPPLAPPHYQYHRDQTGNRARDNGNSKKNDDASSANRKRGDRADEDDEESHTTSEQDGATTVTSGTHRFPGSAGTGSMMVRRRSRTASSGLRQADQDAPFRLTAAEVPRLTTADAPPLPAYNSISLPVPAPPAPDFEATIELKPLRPSSSLASNASSPAPLANPLFDTTLPSAPVPQPHAQHEALALASELEDTERQLQALLLKREQLALRQSQIDLRELAAQAAARQQQQQQQQQEVLPSAPSLDAGAVFIAPNSFVGGLDDNNEAMNETDKVCGEVVGVDANSDSDSTVSGPLISVPAMGAGGDGGTSSVPVSPSTSGFGSSSEGGSSSSVFGDKIDSASLLATTCEENVTASVPEADEMDMRSESEFSLVSAGSA